MLIEGSFILQRNQHGFQLGSKRISFKVEFSLLLGGRETTLPCCLQNKLSPSKPNALVILTVVKYITQG